MQPHQQRVVDEKAELSEKLDKLEAFEGGAIYSGLPPAEQSRLTRQLFIMKLYEQVLAERISEFPKPRPTIAELDAILNSEEDTPITVNPDGSISAL
jgi:hypothetical protein